MRWPSHLSVYAKRPSSQGLTGMREQPTPEWLAAVRAARSVEGGPATPACLDDPSLAQLVDGSATEPTRATGLAHLATCGRCRSAVALLSRALSDSAVRRECGTITPRRRFAPLIATAAIAAALLLVVRPWTRSDALSDHRASPITAAPAPQGLWPVGTVSSARELHWSPVPGASRYRVTLFDSAGVARYEATITDTILELPASAAPVPGRRYWWSVNAALGIDRWVGSTLTEFIVQPDSR